MCLLVSSALILFIIFFFFANFVCGDSNRIINICFLSIYCFVWKPRSFHFSPIHSMWIGKQLRKHQTMFKKIDIYKIQLELPFLLVSKGAAGLTMKFYWRKILPQTNTFLMKRKIFGQLTATTFKNFAMKINYTLPFYNYQIS